MLNNKQLLEIINGSLDTYNNLENLAEPVRRTAANDAAKSIYKSLPKRRPFLFKIITQHNDEKFLNTEVFYLEPNENRKDFVSRSKKYLTDLHGSGVISYQSINIDI
ncbi:hypothetical protein N9H09_02075 [bacterium]|nr:hypothetical protein [bacterium]